MEPFEALLNRIAKTAEGSTPENTEKSDRWAQNLYSSWAQTRQRPGVDIPLSIFDVKSARVNCILPLFFAQDRYSFRNLQTPK